MIRKHKEKGQYPIIHGWVYRFESGLIKDLLINNDILDEFKIKWLETQKIKNKSPER